MTKARDLANGATALSAVSATELGYLDGVTSAVQTQIDGKQAVVSGVNNTEIGYLDGVTSAIQTQLDAKIPKTLTTTTGDIIYASGANTPARLGIGSTGNVLTVSGGVPTWSAPAGGGKVLQVVSTAYSTQQLSTSTSYSDTGLSATITPSSTSSKILILVGQSFFMTFNGGQELSLVMNVVRGSTQIYEASIGYRAAAYGSEINHGAIHSPVYLDSPSSTSALTYKTQFKNPAPTGVVYVNNRTSTITLMEIGA